MEKSMDLIFFSKFLKDRDVRGLVEAAREFGIEGYDLCVRDGYPVSPDNFRQTLPGLLKEFRREKISVGMVTGPTDLINPDHSAAEKILAGMAENGVGLLKLGYVILEKQDEYWKKVEAFRKSLAGWETLARKYKVKICYHTHSGTFLGGNCAAIMHLLKGFDPQFIGAYIDPAHMRLEGEAFSFGRRMVREYLSIVALKDVAMVREQSGDEGHIKVDWVPAGEGAVEWSNVFQVLAESGFNGPLSVHAEYHAKDQREFESKLKREVAYFRKKRDEALAALKKEKQ